MDSIFASGLNTKNNGKVRQIKCDYDTTIPCWLDVIFANHSTSELISFCFSVKSIMDPTAVLSKALNISPNAARFVFAGLAVLAAAAAVVGWQYDPDDLIRVGGLIVGFAVVVTVLANLHGLIARLAAWFVFGATVLYVSVGLFQFLSGNRYHPPLPPVVCFVAPFGEQCTRLMASSAVTPGSGHLTTGSAISLQPEGVSPTPAPVDVLEGKRVFMQFAGSITRESMKDLAVRLKSEGWVIPGGDRGGERTDAARGVNEVRYFHKQDREAANQLTAQVTGNNPANSSVGTRDLSSGGYRAPEGTLELWISN